MKSDANTSRLRAAGEVFEKTIREDRSTGCALLCALLDAEVLFQKEDVPIAELTPLWNLYCRECTLEEEAEHLGFSASSEAGVCTLADSKEVARRLAARLTGRRLSLPNGDITLKELLENFTAYCRQELNIEIDDQTATWGGRCFFSSGRCHHVLIRPRPLLLRPHPQAFILMLCHLPAAGIAAVINLFVERSAYRQRLAMVDLETGFKINLTRSDVFVHFERYLRRIHGLRLVVHPELTQGLIDGGIMKLEMG